MTDEPRLPDPPDTLAQCPGCLLFYEAGSVPFCECLTPTPTPKCPRCGACLCKLPAEAQRSFWSKAPDVLHQRRLEARRGAPSTPVAPPEVPLKRPLVLVAEDEPVTLQVAKRVLERLGYGVALADQGEVAYALAKELLPDLVLTDALMPKMDGRQLCLKLKSEQATAHIKVVVMTGLYTKSKDKSDTLASYRADAFLKKPINFADLEEVLTQLLPLSKD